MKDYCEKVEKEQNMMLTVPIALFPFAIVICSQNSITLTNPHPLLKALDEMYCAQNQSC